MSRSRKDSERAGAARKGMGGKAKVEPLRKPASGAGRSEQAVGIGDKSVKDILFSTTVAVYTSKATGNYGVTFISDNVTKIVGYEAREFMEDSSFWINHIHPKDRQRILAELPHLFESGRHTHEYRFLHKNGTYIWIRDELKLLRDASGSAVEIVGYWINISEQKQAEEELQKERDFAESLVETAQAIVLVLDTRGRIVSFNPYMEEITGYKLEEVLGLDWFSAFLPKRDRECIRELFKKAAADIQTSGNVNSIVTKNGQEREIEWYDKTLKDKEGNIIGVLATGQDITERRRAKESLRESEERFRSLFNQAADAIVVFDTQTREIVEFNNKANEMLGYSREEFAKLKLSDIEAIESEEEITAHIDKIARQNGDTFETKQRKKDGTLCDVLVSAKLVTIAGKQYVQGIWRDITQIKKNEEQLQQERNLLRTLIDHIPDGVYVKDKDSRFIACNRAVAEYWGLKSESDAIGKTDFDLFAKETAQPYFDEEQKVIRTGQPLINREGQCVDKAGNVHYVLATKMPLRDGHGNISGIVGVNRDITERKEAEEEMRRLNRVMETIANINQIIFRIKDREELLKKVCDAIVRYAYRMVWIGFCDEKTKQIVPQAQAGFEKGYLESVKITYDDSEHGMGPSGMAVKTARPNVMRFIATDPRYESWRAEAIKRGYRSSAAIPIFGADKVVGTLNVYADKEDAFNQEEVKLLEELAHDISTGLRGIDEYVKRLKAEQNLLEYQKQLKRLAAQLTLAEECERRRIAGELHDQVGQELALAKIKLDALRASATARPADEVLAEVSETLRQLIDETRSLTFDLSYPILYEIGFEAAVSEWLNEQVRDKNDIAVEFADDGLDKPLDDDVRMLLFRNVRELLINCIKHANADKVKVGIRRIDDSIEVTVEDDGVGFDPVEVRTTTTPEAGFGLFSIRESLEEFGGRIEIESKPGAGCKVIMTAPLKGRPRKKEE